MWVSSRRALDRGWYIAIAAATMASANAKQFRTVRSVTAGGVILAAGIGLFGLSSSASADEVQPPIAFTGASSGGGSLTPDQVMVEIQPDPDYLDSLPDGASVHNSVVPSSSITTDRDGYSVRVDPTTLPAVDITAHGLVTFFVHVSSPDGTVFSQDIVSARAVLTSDGSYAWTDAGAPTEAVVPSDDLIPDRASKAVASARRRGFVPTVDFAKTVKPVVVSETHGSIQGSLPAVRRTELRRLRDSARGPQKGATVSSDDGDGDADSATSVIDDPVYDASKCVEGPTGGAGDVYGRTVDSPATIGTAYPVGGDTAWMMFDSGTSDGTDFKASFGTAFDNGLAGQFSAGREKEVDRSVGFDWDPKSYMRSFRVGMVYQHVAHYYDRCPPHAPYDSDWLPQKYSGGFGENTVGVNRPDWNQCVTIFTTGTWKKESTDSKAYKYDAGVKFADVIGLDLAVTRRVNKQASLRYHIGLVGRQMCGNDDTPGTSTKVMEKGRK
jgi:hypothetical protein